ncbi:MAG: adenylosuccinate synthetase, partial [Vicinamibacteria bacterium]
IRYGGGNNAGHTVVNPHGHFKLHLIPSGIFHPGTRNLLGNGVVINPPALVAELDGLRDAGFDAAWEADLFGARRRALEGASARLQATEAEAQGVRMRIVAEVARTWFTAVGARYELHAQQATLDTLQQTWELVRLRHALGDASAADVEAAYAQWTAVNALIPDIQARQRAAILS